MKNALATYHPAASFLFFAAAVGLTMISFHPVYSIISLFCALAYSLVLNGPKALTGSLKMCFLLFTMVVFINTFFNKNGFTPLFSFGDHIIYKEGFVFGLCSGSALCAAILWFSCYSLVIDNDKFLYLFSRLSPSGALLISLTLGQAIDIRRKAETVKDSQFGLYGSDPKKFKQRFHLAMLRISALLNWSLEDSVETADSMQARGYGTGRQSRMTPYRFMKHDFVFLFVVVAFIAAAAVAFARGRLSFTFYPVTGQVAFDTVSLIGYTAHAVFMTLPILLEIKEAVQWRFYMSKI